MKPLSRWSILIRELFAFFRKVGKPIITGQRYLAGRLGCSITTIKRAMKELRDAGILASERRYRRSSKHTLTDPAQTSFCFDGPTDGPTVVKPLSLKQERVEVSSPLVVFLRPEQREEVALSPDEQAVRKRDGLERLSEGDRRFFAESVARVGLGQVTAGVILARARHMTSRAAAPIRSLRYFSGAILEAAQHPAGYIEHCADFIRRH